MQLANKEETWAALNNPQPGMNFTEMMSYHVKIIDRDGDTVVWEGASGHLHVQTVADFVKYHAYTSMSFGWVDLVIPEPLPVAEGI